MTSTNQQQCLAACNEHPQCSNGCQEAPFAYVNVIATIMLLMLSAMFSGLTLGLLSLSLEGLDIIIHGGHSNESKWAARIYPVRKRGNLLLCTLLLGNTMVNSLASPTRRSHPP